MFTEEAWTLDMANEGQMSRKREALKDALVDSAEQIIAERGYLALRARELAQDVGCALGAIYTVFPDLDALVREVKERTLDELEAQIAARFAEIDRAAGGKKQTGVKAAQQRLLALADIYLAFASSRPKLWQALFEHRSPAAANAPEAYQENLERILSHVERPLDEIMPIASLKARRLFARALFSAVHGVLILGLDEKLGALPADLLAWQMRAIVQTATSGAADHPELARLDGAG
jgi:AcrR family transcriptional regulator